MIKGIVETVSAPSLINLDFADFKTIVRRGGVAVVGVGESDAPNRAEDAVRNALRSPLLDVDYAGARGALIHVSGDGQMTIEEVNGRHVKGYARDDRCELASCAERIRNNCTSTLQLGTLRRTRKTA